MSKTAGDLCVDEEYAHTLRSAVTRVIPTLGRRPGPSARRHAGPAVGIRPPGIRTLPAREDETLARVIVRLVERPVPVRMSSRGAGFPAKEPAKEKVNNSKRYPKPGSAATSGILGPVTVCQQPRWWAA
jgi:hypothetical protein